MIKLTGIADEAGASLDVQIQAHQELGWDSIESRAVELDGVKGNLHEIPDALFDQGGGAAGGEKHEDQRLRLAHWQLGQEDHG